MSDISRQTKRSGDNASSRKTKKPRKSTAVDEEDASEDESNQYEGESDNASDDDPDLDCSPCVTSSAGNLNGTIPGGDITGMAL